MSGDVVPVPAPTVTVGEYLSVPTITLADGSRHSGNPEVRKEMARARMAAVKAGVVQAARSEAQISVFEQDQRKAGKIMTPAEAKQNQVYAARLAFATALEKHLDKDGRVSSDIMNSAEPLLSGYKLPAGIRVNAQSVFLMCQVARKANFSQDIVDRYIKAELELGLFP